MAAEQTEIKPAPDGKATGATTKAASTWSASGATVASALSYVLTYLLVRVGFEQDPEQAVAIGGAVSLLIVWAAGKVAGLTGGKRTPTDQVQLRDRTLIREVDATDPELKAAVIAVATAAGLVPGQGAQQVPDGGGEHRATPRPADSVAAGSTAAAAPAGDPVVSAPADAEEEALPPIVQPVEVEVPEDPASGQ